VQIDWGCVVSFTYADIRDALASEDIVCRQERMGGGCAALAVDDGRGGLIFIGCGEWTVWESFSESVWEGIVSVTTESADGVDSAEWGRFAQCTTDFGVLAVVVALLDDGTMECGTCGERHDALALREDTRIGFDPMPTFDCPTPDARTCNACGEYCESAAEFDGHACNGGVA